MIRQVGQRLRQYIAATHVSDVAIALLTEADQHPPFPGNVLDPETRSPTIVPDGATNGLTERYILQCTDAAEILHEDLLFVLQLRLVVEMLQRAAATNAKDWTTGRYALCGRRCDIERGRLVVAATTPLNLKLNRLAGQRAGHEDTLTVPLRHAATIVCQIDNIAADGIRPTACHIRACALAKRPKNLGNAAHPRCLTSRGLAQSRGRAQWRQ